MRKFFLIPMVCFILFGSTTALFGQEKKLSLIDGQQKETLYLKYKKEVQAYSKKEFDALFFEFFQKQNDKTILTQEEYYTYTVKIAIYSEKLGLLYKDQKDEAQRTKQEWLDKNYQDYRHSKK
ncbi:MAG: hypothetical protein V4648_05040 [Bacteroidota bacterium]